MKTETTIHKKKTRKPLLFLGMISIVMLFIGFTSGYIVMRPIRDWVVFDLPYAFSLSTAIIILSSFIIQKTIKTARSNNYKLTVKYLGITFMLGLGFTLLQVLGWNDLVEREIFFRGGSVSGSFVYVITGAHLTHLIAGLVSIIVMFQNAKQKKYSNNDILGLELGVIFWHFLGGLWLFLFLFLQLIR